MTAGSGLVHEEMHGHEYSKRGGPFEMVQLWVNLPARHKMAQPNYQTLLNAGQFPRSTLPDGAGAHASSPVSSATRTGPAKTFTPINVWDVRPKAGKSTVLRVARGPYDRGLRAQGDASPSTAREGRLKRSS